jgi:ElaB/YqjD/DUF883 family membrane-anchored ribosome-binding protein
MLNETTDKLRGRATDALHVVSERASSAYHSGRERANNAYQSGRDKASTTLEDSPLALLAGGLALGALVGALLPRNAREADILGGVGGKLNHSARQAGQAARGAIKEAGINRDNLRDKLDRLIETATQAVSQATSAAANSVKQGDRKD